MVKEQSKIMEVKVIVSGTYTNKEGEEFIGYKTVLKDGKKYDLRFKKDCQNIPTKNCIAYVKKENISIDYRYQYPRVWIANVEMTKEYSVLSGERVSELFDEVQ